MEWEMHEEFMEQMKSGVD